MLMAEAEPSHAMDPFKVNKIAEQLAQKYDRIKRIGLWLNQGSCYVQEEQEKFKEAQARLHQGYNPKMRSEISRLKSFENLKSYSSCSPSERAKGGFYCTEDGSYMQCFCCGFVLLGTPQDKTPYICHQEFQPNCDFIKGLEVGNIPKYEVRVQQNIDIDLDKVQVYSIEEKRVESYKDWPNYSKADLIRLARAGFYFTGVRDTVQCHCCGGTLSHWEQEDDPWKEHAKWFPECEFLQSKKSWDEIAHLIKEYDGFTGISVMYTLNSVAYSLYC
uniref:Uncharacterized protein n=1 Tax=Erpetoichthys calabaricus TaxID=27687 RepID=A0A8C4SU31_ERPCA